MFQNQKDSFIPDITQAEEIQKSASMELKQMEWNCGKCWKLPIFEGKFQVCFCFCFFVFFSYLSEMKTVCKLYNFSLLQHFLQIVSTIFLFWRYLNSSMTSFLSDILLPFPNSNNLNSCVHRCTKNDNYLVYGSWDTEYNVQSILSFRTIFYSFTPLTTWKIKTWKNEKTKWRYYHFTFVFHKWQSYVVWFPKYGAWQTEFVVILDHFCPVNPLTTQKIIILKKWRRKILEISSFYTCVP